MAEDLLKQVLQELQKTDWLGYSVDLLAAVIPILYIIFTSKKDNEELDDRQRKLENAQIQIAQTIELLSDYQIKIGLSEKRIQGYYFIKDLGDDWCLYYQYSQHKGKYVYFNHLAKSILEKYGSLIENYSNEQLDELMLELMNNHNKQDRQFENLLLYFSLSNDQQKSILSIKKEFMILFRYSLEFLSEYKKTRKANVNIESIQKLKDKFESEQYKKLIDFLKNEIILKPNDNKE